MNDFWNKSHPNGVQKGPPKMISIVKSRRYFAWASFFSTQRLIAACLKVMPHLTPFTLRPQHKSTSWSVCRELHHLPMKFEEDPSFVFLPMPNISIFTFWSHSFCHGTHSNEILQSLQSYLTEKFLDFAQSYPYFDFLK